MELIEKDEEVLGYEGEAYSRVITYKVDTKYLNYNIFINFDAPVGKYKVQVPAVELGEYLVEAFLMQKKGPMYAQLEAVDDNGYIISRSAIVTYYIKESIKCDVTINELFRLQEKEVTPTDEAQEVTPDDSYYGLSKVIVGAGGGGSSIDITDEEIDAVFEEVYGY